MAENSGNSLTHDERPCHPVRSGPGRLARPGTPQSGRHARRGHRHSLSPSDDPRLNGVTLIRGDCQKQAILEEAGLLTARGVVVLPSDELVSITTALLVRQRLNPSGAGCRSDVQSKPGFPPAGHRRKQCRRPQHLRPGSAAAGSDRSHHRARSSSTVRLATGQLCQVAELTFSAQLAPLRGAHMLPALWTMFMSWPILQAQRHG